MEQLLKNPLHLLRALADLPNRLDRLERRQAKDRRTAARNAEAAREDLKHLHAQVESLAKQLERAEASNAAAHRSLSEASRRHLARRVRQIRLRTQINDGRSFNASHEHMGYQPHPLGGFNSHEFSVYSQNGEDGLLLHIFDVIGMGGRRFAEMSPADGFECNTINLVANFGWSGLMVDASAKRVEGIRRLVRSLIGAGAERVQAREAFVTAENAGELLRQAGLPRDLDLLSIDIDGNDYWVWRALEGFAPRVVVVEYNELMGEEAVTVPYDPSFERGGDGRSRACYGASFEAFRRLGKAKGYALLGSDSSGTNLFFVRHDLVHGPLLDHVQVAAEAGGTRRRFWQPADPDLWRGLDKVRIGEDGEPL